ncbi:integral membrane protein (TIGR01906 family) [Arthrobacter sp. UYP6]|uniref:TIGR01906 family membrane protein n=1 Tax=Arthrobacter sp. UYP6 TaxID=1756378 RepID=UPI0033913C72
MEPQKPIGIRKTGQDTQAREVKEEAVASQDETPQQHPTPGGSAKPEQDRAEQGAADGHELSDASETIVSGGHAAGSDKTNDGGPAGSADSAGSAAGTPDDGLDHDDWDAAFADAAGMQPAAKVPGETPPLADAAVVPGGHPSLAQRSTLPMRRASTMPNVSGYGDLSEEKQQRAGHIDAVVPEPGIAAQAPQDHVRAGATDAAAVSAASPKTTPISTGLSSGSHRAGNPDAAGTGEGALEVEPAAASKPAAERGAEHVAEPAAEPVAERVAEPAAEPVVERVADPVVDPSDRPASDEISEEEIRRRAEDRERAGTAKPVLARILQVMIAVFFPVMLLAAAIRAVATPLFLWAEYHRPGFPSDSYGFSTDDRMTYGSYAVDYLLNFSGARYLGDLVTLSGEPLYLESEVSHMADVKTVLTIAFVAALAMAVLSLLACIYLAKRSPGGIRRALFAGSVLTLVLVGALIVTAVLGWENFFTQVHSIFFANGNWTFRLDDTLIRLFPAQFWMDAGIVIASLVLLTCIVVLIAAWPTKARRERSRLKQEEARRRYLDSLEAV